MSDRDNGGWYNLDGERVNIQGTPVAPLSPIALDEAKDALLDAISSAGYEHYEGEELVEDYRRALVALVAQEEREKAARVTAQKKYDLANDIREMWLTSDNFARDLNALCEKLHLRGTP